MSQTKIKNKTNQHIPVLLHETIELLAPKIGERYLDLTAGYGGHAQEIIIRTGSDAVLVDRDENAIAVLENKFVGKQVRLMHDGFYEASKQLVSDDEKFDLIFADLGVSSPHLDNGERGFSITKEAKLDMRMDPRQELSAYDVVNEYSLDELVRVLREYGEEPRARAMAKAIISARPISTTNELATVAKRIWPGHSRTHPATRLFQALRIEVNDELGQLERTLPNLTRLLRPGGRLAIITFHSLEDRIVKRFFKQLVGDGYDAEFTELTPKPLTPSESESVTNPRARSAKIRAYAVKIKTKEGQG